MQHSKRCCKGCCGTWAGVHGDFIGAAPLAKFAFTDIGVGTSGDLYLPDDLSTDYYSYAYNMYALAC